VGGEGAWGREGGGWGGGGGVIKTISWVLVVIRSAPCAGKMTETCTARDWLPEGVSWDYLTPPGLLAVSHKKMAFVFHIMNYNKLFTAEEC